MKLTDPAMRESGMCSWRTSRLIPMVNNTHTRAGGGPSTRKGAIFPGSPVSGGGHADWPVSAACRDGTAHTPSRAARSLPETGVSGAPLISGIALETGPRSLRRSIVF
jgi:hypothetical protein